MSAMTLLYIVQLAMYYKQYEHVHVQEGVTNCDYNLFLCGW